MASRVTQTAEEEGVEVGGVEEEGGRFSRSWASLHRIELAHIAPMMVKRGERGIGMEKC